MSNQDFQTDERQATFLLGLRLPREKETEDLLRRGFRANYFVALDDCGNANTRGAILRSLVDPNHFAHRANENFRTASHFGRESECNVKLGSRAQILIDCKVNAACGNVARLSAARGCLIFNWHPDNDRQRQVISTSSSPLCHLLVPPNPFFQPASPTPTKKREQLKFQSDRTIYVTSQVLPTVKGRHDSGCLDLKPLRPSELWMIAPKPLLRRRERSGEAHTSIVINTHLEMRSSTFIQSCCNSRIPIRRL